jgi:hypothetical protein
MNIHCSACGAPLPQGARFCPACALPLTAIAMPTPQPRKKPVSILAIVFCAFGILWVIAYASDAHTQAKHDAADAAAKATAAQQLTAHLALEDSLVTPAAFQKRCGPAHVLRGASAADTRGMDPAILQGATTLVYPRRGTTMDVLLLPHFPIHLQFREHSDGEVFRFTGYSGLLELGCVKADAQ